MLAWGALAPLGAFLTPTSPAVYVYGRANFQAGNNGSVLAAGDFDSDGRPDFAALGFQDDSLAILLAHPDGSFADSGVVYQVGLEPVAGVAGHFDGDGKLDLAVVNLLCPQNSNSCPPGSVSILLGNGDGTFQPRTDFTTGPAPIGVVTGDFNSDGKLDLAVADRISVVNSGSPGMVSILLGNGDGTFQPPRDFAAGDGVGGLVAGDFNGDAKLDLVVDTHPSVSSITVPLLLGNGDGTFRQPVIVNVGADPVALTTGDFNKDGRLDLAIATGLPKIAVLLANGNGTFQAPVEYATDIGPFRIVASDLNADGNLELVASVATSAKFSGAVSVFRGNGDGTFQPNMQYVTGTTGPLYMGDFNADGKQDVAIGSGSGGVRIVLGNGDGMLAHPVDYPTGRFPDSLVAAEFNGDGKQDLAVVNGNDNSISILLGNGNGTFGPHVDYATGSGPVDAAVADLNADGKPDLAVTNSFGNAASILLGNGDGTFMPHVDYATGGSPVGAVIAEFNGDGKLDLAIANLTDGTISILLGNGDGTFKPRVDYASGPGSSGLVAADFNRDGRTDLAVADSGTPVTLQDPGLVSVLLGNGDGTFQPHADSPVASLTPISLTATDFNDDGEIDLAVAAKLNELGFVFILLGGGNASFQAGGSYFTGASSAQFSADIMASDFNGDTKQDLAVCNVGSNKVTLLKGNGNGTFQVQSDYGTGIGPVGLATGDFNGDAQSDMAVAVAGANSTSVFLSGAALAPDFSVSGAPLSQTVSPGQRTSYAISVSPIGGYSQTVTLSCSGAPPKSTCSVSPSSVSLDGTAALDATVTATTTAPSFALLPSARMDAQRWGFGWVLYLVVAAICCLLTLTLRGVSQRMVRISCIAVLMVAAPALTSCGGSSGEGSGDPGTPPGTYTIVVTGTSGAVSHTASLKLVVN